MSSKGTQSGILPSDVQNQIRRDSKRRKRANTGHNAAPAVRTDRHVGTGLRGASAKRQELAEAAANQRETLISQVANRAVQHFVRWTKTNDRALATWTNQDDIDAARTAIYLAFGTMLDGFNAMLDELPKRGTYRNDVYRAIILTITARRNAARLAELDITFVVESQDWFSNLRGVMDKSRAVAVA